MTIDTVTTDSRFKNVRLWTSKVSHIVDIEDPLLPDSVPERAPSLCNMKPIWPGVWIDQTTPEAPCKLCARVKEARLRDLD